MKTNSLLFTLLASSVFCSFASPVKLDNTRIREFAYYYLVYETLPRNFPASWSQMPATAEYNQIDECYFCDECSCDDTCSNAEYNQIDECDFCECCGCSDELLDYPW